MAPSIYLIDFGWNDIDFYHTIYDNDDVAVSSNAPGRPYYRADIPFRNETKVQFLDEFYGAIAKLTYREVMALSRTLSVHPSTIYNWKYRLSFPKYHIAIDIIQWSKRGKPLNKIYQQRTVGML